MSASGIAAINDAYFRRQKIFPPALIIFDCDGTLTDSEFVNNQALIEVLAEDGFHYTLEHAYEHWVGSTVSNILLMIQMEQGRAPAPDIVPRYIARVARLQQTALRPVEGAEQLVEACAATFRICVASNGERSNVLRSLELTGLMKYFSEDTVFTKIQVAHPKPAPDLFLFAAAAMDADPRQSIVIEDSAAGVTAGVAAGMTTWGFTGAAHDPIKQRETLKKAGAHHIFESHTEIAEKLGLSTSEAA